MSKTISAGRAPNILIEHIGGDLSLVGWEGEDILLKGDDDEIVFKQDGGTVTISCEDDISIRMPKGGSVFIKHIEGDAAIRGVFGEISIQHIEGDLSIRDTGNIFVETIESDLSLKAIKGNLSVKNAQSDVSIRDVEGNILLTSVADDLALRDARGSVQANIGEDVVLYLDPKPENTYSITAGDDILLVMPPSANATLTLNADEIDIEWKGVEQDDEATSRVITLGDGSAKLTLSAGGNIRVTNQASAGEFAEDFGNFAGIGFDWSGFGDRISRQVEQATRRAAQKAEEAGRKAERAAERAKQRGAFLKVGRWNWDVSPKGVPLAPKPQASDEERLAILKMLQEKKISAEDAEKLLAALEGDS